MPWPGPQGRAETAERPFYPKPALDAPWAQQVWSGAARQRHPASSPRHALLCPLKAQRTCAPPPGVSTLSRPPAWLGLPVSGVLPETGSPTLRGVRTGAHSASEGFEVEHCPPLVLFLKCPAVSRCQSPVYQPFNSPAPPPVFFITKNGIKSLSCLFPRAVLWG